MHFDLAHALVTAALLFVIVTVMQKTGLYKSSKDGGPRFSWPLFLVTIVVIFGMNIIWPTG